jgi:hypothetical protein
LIIGNINQRRQSGERRAAVILINSGELCRSVSRENFQATFSCDAMESEMKPGDTMLLDRTSGAGMTVRYLLPRNN